MPSYEEPMNKPMVRADDDAFDAQPSIDILGTVRRNVGAYVAITAVVSALTLAGALAVMALPPIDQSSTLDVTLTFPKAEAGTYPNGAPFSPNDVIAGSVVEAVWRAQGLEKSVALDLLMRNLQAVPGGTAADLLRSEYAQKLSNAKLTVAERSSLEQEFRARLSSESAASLRISASCSGTGLAPAQAERFLLELPAEWSRQQDAAGANALDFPVPSAKDLQAVAESLSRNASVVEQVFAAERASDGLALLAATGASVVARDGSKSIKGPNDSSIADLNQEIAAVRRNLVIPSYVQALSAARAADPAGFRAIRSARQAVLEADIARETESVRVWREMVAQVTGESRPRVGGQTAGSVAPTAPSQDIQASLDSSFIDRVIDQAIQGSDLPYRRSLMQSATKAELHLADLQAQQKFERWIDSEVEAVHAGQSPGQRMGTSPADMLRRVAGLSLRMSEVLAVLGGRDLNPESSMFRIGSPPRLVLTRILELRSVALAGAAFWFAAIGLFTAFAVVRHRRSVHEPAALLGTRQYPAEHHVAGAVAGLQDRRETDPRRISQAPREPVA
jgi:hypothetical protein